MVFETRERYQHAAKDRRRLLADGLDLIASAEVIEIRSREGRAMDGP